jgi:hypothetical protein
MLSLSALPLHSLSPLFKTLLRLFPNLTIRPGLARNLMHDRLHDPSLTLRIARIVG